jgi:hypothetical protein
MAVQGVDRDVRALFGNEPHGFIRQPCSTVVYRQERYAIRTPAVRLLSEFQTLNANLQKVKNQPADCAVKDPDNGDRCPPIAKQSGEELFD